MMHSSSKLQTTIERDTKSDYDAIKARFSTIITVSQSGWQSLSNSKFTDCHIEILAHRNLDQEKKEHNND